MEEEKEAIIYSWPSLPSEIDFLLQAINFTSAIQKKRHNIQAIGSEKKFFAHFCLFSVNLISVTKFLWHSSLEMFLEKNIFVEDGEKIERKN